MQYDRRILNQSKPEEPKTSKTIIYIIGIIIISATIYALSMV